MSVTVPLRRPIEAHGETVTSITLREPLGGDIARIGMPVNVIGVGGHVDTAVVAAYIAELGGIPPSSVAKLSAADFLALTTEVVDFFADTSPPPSASSISPSPASGATSAS